MQAVQQVSCLEDALQGSPATAAFKSLNSWRDSASALSKKRDSFNILTSEPVVLLLAPAVDPRPPVVGAIKVPSFPALQPLARTWSPKPAHCLLVAPPVPVRLCPAALGVAEDPDPVAPLEALARGDLATRGAVQSIFDEAPSPREIWAPVLPVAHGVHVHLDVPELEPTPVVALHFRTLHINCWRSGKAHCIGANGRGSPPVLQVEQGLVPALELGPALALAGETQLHTP